MSTVENFDPLVADQLQAALPGAIIGRRIIVLEQTSSTNDAIWRIASADGLPCIADGLVVFAEYQTDGRGQRGNHWESAPRKGLWFSMLLRPEIQLNESGRLTIWAIETISDVIRTTFRLEPAIKLPNDIRVDGRKVSGVLVEMRAQTQAPHLAVVGIGVNVNQVRDDFPPDLRDRAISLAIALGRQIDRRDFAVALLRKLDVTYRENFAVAESDDPGSKIPYSTLPRSTAAAKPSPARTTTRDMRAAKFRTA